jgi:simple sugar transport system permease protein
VLAKTKEIIDRFGIARVIIIAFLILLYISAALLGISPGNLLSQNLVRMGMNGVLVLAMVPCILAGTGLNFGIPIGIVCGLVGGLLAIELNLRGFPAFFFAVACSLPLAAIIGYGYGKLLNKVKGSEMMVSTYAGWSAISLMCIGWLLLPFSSPELKWPIGRGLRVTISLKGRYDKILNDALAFNIGNVTIPTGLLLFFLIACLLVWLFLRSKTGLAMKAAGDNPRFAAASGINVDKYRIIGVTISTMLGAVGIIVYAQSYGFIQLYLAPLMMGFAAVAAILIGGASSTKAKIIHVIVGVFLFQGLLVVALPVANAIIPTGNLSEVMRVIVQYGIILYALTKVGGGE